MIHLAEPYGLWAIQADAAFRAEFPLADACAQIQFVDDVAAPLARKHRLFDAGLFAFAAPGCLRGDATLAQCMKDGPLRELAGRAMLDEIPPLRAVSSREEAAPYVIECFERYANPMNDNAVLDAARGLIRKFNRGVLPGDARLRGRALAASGKADGGAGGDGAPLRRRARAGRPLGDRRRQETRTLHESPDALAAFSRLSSDMDAESLAYAVLSDRELWNGADLREIEGLAELLSENLAK